MTTAIAAILFAMSVGPSSPGVLIDLPNGVVTPVPVERTPLGYLTNGIRRITADGMLATVDAYLERMIVPEVHDRSSDYSISYPELNLPPVSSWHNTSFTSPWFDEWFDWRDKEDRDFRSSGSRIFPLALPKLNVIMGVLTNSFRDEGFFMARGSSMFDKTFPEQDWRGLADRFFVESRQYLEHSHLSVLDLPEHKRSSEYQYPFSTLMHSAAFKAANIDFTKLGRNSVARLHALTNYLNAINGNETVVRIPTNSLYRISSHDLGFVNASLALLDKSYHDNKECTVLWFTNLSANATMYDSYRIVGTAEPNEGVTNVPWSVNIGFVNNDSSIVVTKNRYQSDTVDFAVSERSGTGSASAQGEKRFSENMTMLVEMASFMRVGETNEYHIAGWQDEDHFWHIYSGIGSLSGYEWSDTGFLTERLSLSGTMTRYAVIELDEPYTTYVKQNPIIPHAVVRNADYLSRIDLTSAMSISGPSSTSGQPTNYVAVLSKTNMNANAVVGRCLLDCYSFQEYERSLAEEYFGMEIHTSDVSNLVQQVADEYYNLQRAMSSLAYNLEHAPFLPYFEDRPMIAVKVAKGDVRLYYEDTMEELPKDRFGAYIVGGVSLGSVDDEQEPVPHNSGRFKGTYYSSEEIYWKFKNLPLQKEQNQ